MLGHYIVDHLASNNVLVLIHSQLRGNVVTHLAGFTKIKITHLCSIDLSLIGKEQNVTAIIGIFLINDEVAFLQLLLVCGAHRLNRKLLEITALGKNQSAIVVLKEDILLVLFNTDFFFDNFGFSRFSVFLLN